MAREEFDAQPGLVLEMIEKLSRGGRGVVVVPGERWQQLQEAYNSKLLEDITDDCMDLSPRRSVPGKELSFRVLIRA